MDCSLPGYSVCGISQGRILECVAISFSRGSSQPRDHTWVSHIAGRLFTVWATGEDQRSGVHLAKCKSTSVTKPNLRPPASSRGWSPRTKQARREANWASVKHIYSARLRWLLCSLFTPPGTLSQGLPPPPTSVCIGAPSPATLCFGRSLAYLSQDIYHLHPCQSSPLLEVWDNTISFGMNKGILFLNWRIIALQCCGGLCRTSTWVSHNYICIPPLLSLPPPKGILLINEYYAISSVILEPSIHLGHVRTMSNFKNQEWNENIWKLIAF